MTIQTSLRFSLFALLSLALVACSGDAEVEGGDDSCDAYQGDGCTPDETRDCDSGFTLPDGSNFIGTDTCRLVDECETKWFCEYNTPIVLSFDSSEPELIIDPAHNFDLNGGMGVVTDWVSAKTPWLSMDRNGNASIDDGSELFGSMTALAAGGRGRNGFIALRDLDTDGDGVLTPLDPGFAELTLWRDTDGDRRSSARELVSAANARVVSIDLGYVSAPVCDARGNCTIERAPFYWIDERDNIRAGSAIDVHFAAQR